MDCIRVIEILNTAGYRVQFYTAPANDKFPAEPAVKLSCESFSVSMRGVNAEDALRSATEYVLSEIEQKRISELERRGALHSELTSLLK
jgi:hypothetical protein